MTGGDEVIGNEKDGDQTMQEQVGSDEIVIDEEIYDSNGTFSEVRPSTRNHENIEMGGEEDKKSSVDEREASQRHRSKQLQSLNSEG